MTTWHELHLTLKRDQVEAAEAYLNDHGAVAITLLRHQQKVLIADQEATPLSDIVKLQALFDTPKVRVKLNQAIEKMLGSGCDIEWHIIGDSDWLQSFQQSFSAFDVANKLCIAPQWAPPNTPLPTVLIDPGLAFGTGSHATTRLCLEMLCAYLKPNDTIIDFGSGSGILALSALKLGATHVDAIDIDVQARQKTMENAELNAIKLEQLSVSDDATHCSPADCVVANIVMNTLLELKSTLSRLTKPQGHLILSGILTEQTTTVLEHFSPGFTVSKNLQKEGWSCICLKKT